MQFSILSFKLFLAVAACFPGSAIKAAQPAAPLIWKLDNLQTIGAVKPEVWGAPSIVPAAQDGPALRFNGTNDALFFPTNPVGDFKAFTIEVLLRPAPNAPEAQRFLHIEDVRDARLTIEIRMVSPTAWCLDTYLLDGTNRLSLCDRTKLHPAGSWTWVALVYDGKRMSSYVNHRKGLDGLISFPPMAKGQISLGVRQNRVYWFKGALKEVRFTPAALRPSDLQ